MKSIERVSAIDASTPRMKAGIPGLPIQDVVLMRLVKAVNQGMSAYLEQFFRPIGFSESSFHTLALIFSSERGSASPSMLCDLVGQARANMTRILDDLAAKGYISRAADGHDRRRKQVCITAEGRRLVQKIVPGFYPKITVALKGLSTIEKAALEKLLRKLVISMDGADRQLLVET